MIDDVHVIPDDGKHIASPKCPCGPKEDEQQKRARAQGRNVARVWIHQRLN